MHRYSLLLLLSSFLIAPPASAQQAADEVLADNGVVKLMRSDYETELSRMPPEVRGGFASDPKRLIALLNNLLTSKTLAAQARAEGVDRDPAIVRRFQLETDRFLAAAEVQRIELRAEAEFDAKQAQYLTRAREIYALDRDKYALPAQVSASHILFKTDTRSPDAALALAQDAIAKLKSGADFATLARQVSEDATAKDNGGALGWFTAERMDPAFSKAAFALEKVGDISPPVLSRFGYHVIRLDGRKPAGQQSFEDAKEQIMLDLRRRYVDEQRNQKVDAIRNDPKLKVNQAALDALLQRVGSPSLPAAPQR